MSELPNKATFEALQAEDRLANHLHPEATPGVDMKPWLREIELHPDKHPAEEAAMNAEFAKLRMSATEAGHIRNRAMLHATSHATKREQFARLEDARHAMHGITRGEWRKVEPELSAWLQKEAPKLHAMLTKSGAANDPSVLRELYQTWRSARGRGQA